MSIRGQHLAAASAAQEQLTEIRHALGTIRELLETVESVTAMVVGDASAAPGMIANALQLITTTKGIILAAEDDLETYKEAL